MVVVYAGDEDWTSREGAGVTVEELDKEIERVYRWWAVEAPGVTPREHGYLGQLWAARDQYDEH